MLGPKTIESDTTVILFWATEAKDKKDTWTKMTQLIQQAANVTKYKRQIFLLSSYQHHLQEKVETSKRWRHRNLNRLRLSWGRWSMSWRSLMIPSLVRVPSLAMKNTKRSMLQGESWLLNLALPFCAKVKSGIMSSGITGSGISRYW